MSAASLPWRQTLALGAGALLLASCAPSASLAEDRGTDDTEGVYTLSVGDVVTDLYWSDGDSGRANGLKFRLADIDAPETGGVGARGGAECEAERELGFAAKAFVVELTRTGRAGDAVVVVTDTANVDRYGRQVLGLSVDGEPLDALGIEAGHYGAWPHRKGRAQSPKPDWCARAGRSGAGR